MRIGIVGTGWVGSSIAISTLQSGIANELRVQEGALGLRDIALSLPSIVGTAGAVEVLEPDMETGEREALLRSAGVLREAWDTL